MLLYVMARTQDGQRHCSKYAELAAEEALDVDSDAGLGERTQNQPGSQGGGATGPARLACVAARAWGHGNELTGPEGWRRVLAAYRR
jgi:hypothetical protein